MAGGCEPIPVRVGDELEAFDAATAVAVGQVIAGLNDLAEPVAVIYRDDTQMRDAVPPAQLPLLSHTWWRMVIARATAEVSGVEIRYADEVTTS